MVAESIQFAKLSVEMGCCIGDGIRPPIKRTHLNHPTRAPEIHRTKYLLYKKKSQRSRYGPIHAKRSKPVTEAEIGIAEF
jgi:hypothetical protein